jgi:hypothetical protein
MEKTLEAITKWLKKSGMKVNDEKTKLCLFHRHNTAQVYVCIGDSMVKSKK